MQIDAALGPEMFIYTRSNRLSTNDRLKLSNEVTVRSAFEKSHYSTTSLNLNSITTVFVIVQSVLLSRH